MAGKRPRRGQRISSARELGKWDEDRIRRFVEERLRRRELISFVEIAEWYSDLIGPAEPKTAAAARERAYAMLEHDVLARSFEENGPEVLFLHPGVSLTHWKMTAKWLQRAIDNNYDDEHGRSYLRHCLLPRNRFEHWCAWHHLPKSPRFQPSQESRAHVSPKGAERSPESPMPAPTLVPQPESKLAVDVLEQPEVPSNIQPREVRVLPPQDSGERRGLVAHKDSSLASDDRSDLDTQPPKPSNKGGRPPAADWEALKDALVEEIRIHGDPKRRNPPGWRGTKDVADWAAEKLGKEGRDVSHRTIEDNVRRILRELKAASAAKSVSR
jgi:hypothetical protein